MSEFSTTFKKIAQLNSQIERLKVNLMVLDCTPEKFESLLLEQENMKGIKKSLSHAINPREAK